MLDRVQHDFCFFVKKKHKVNLVPYGEGSRSASYSRWEDKLDSVYSHRSYRVSCSPPRFSIGSGGYQIAMVFKEESPPP